MTHGPEPALHWRDILHTYPCGTCGAEIGASCRSPSGKPQHMPHVDRYQQAHERDWRSWDDDRDDDNTAPPGRELHNEWEQ